MVNGNILLDEDGLNVLNVKDCERRSAVGNFCEMIEEANTEGDILHYIYDSPCSIYSICFDPEDPHCKLIGQRLFTQLQIVFGNFPNSVQSLEEFEAKNEPRTHGGYKYEKCPESDYVYNKDTIDDWHDEWYFKHPEFIDWEKYNNDIWPRFDRTIDILKQELLKVENEIPSKDKDIVNSFHDKVMKHLNERDRISASKRIGAAICKANYYHREEELEGIEADHGNKHAELIYSIKIGNKYQFLSIDTQHGMFELCDDKGEHIMEIRFDGSKNKGKDTNHSLGYVTEWKKKYNK